MTVSAAIREPLVVSAAQPACTPLDVAANIASHIKLITAARARVVVFPELSLTGYELQAPTIGLDHPSLSQLQQACAVAGTVALVGAPIATPRGDCIATLAVDSDGVRVAYSKRHLSEAESARFVAGSAAAVLVVDGWRLGLATCKDTGNDAHADHLLRQGLDAYLAGVVHLPDETNIQDARGRRLSRRLKVPVVLACAAGSAGHLYPQTAGRSTIWSSSGWVLRQCNTEPDRYVSTMLPATRSTGSLPHQPQFN